MAKKKKVSNKKKGTKGGGGSNGTNSSTTKATIPVAEVKPESVVEDANNFQMDLTGDNGPCNAINAEEVENKSEIICREKHDDENQPVGISADDLNDGAKTDGSKTDIAPTTTADESLSPKEASVDAGVFNSLAGDEATESLSGENATDSAVVYGCNEESPIAINRDAKLGENTANQAKPNRSDSGLTDEMLGEMKRYVIVPEKEHEFIAGEVINNYFEATEENKFPAPESNEPLLLDHKAAKDQKIQNYVNQNEISEDDQPDHQAESINQEDIAESAKGPELESVVSEEVLIMVMQSNGDNVIPPTPSRYSSSNISESEMVSTPTISVSDSLDKAPTPIMGKNMRSYSTDLTRETSLVEVDLDEEAETRHEYSPPPMVRAFTGAPNLEVFSVSDDNEGDLKNSHRRPSESDAFVFLGKALRHALDDDAKDVSDGTLSRYIHWKADVTCAAERFRSYLKFRKDNAYIFDEKPLLLSQDPKLSFLLQNGMVLAPENCRARDGSAVLILRAAKCNVYTHGCTDEDASRAIFYMLQTVMDRKTFDPLLGITVVLDLEGVLRKNIPSKLAKLLSKAKGCFPLRIKAIYIVAMPWWFPNHTRYFSPKLRERIFFLKEKIALYEYIEKDRLLEQDGGTLMNFDVQLWISSILLREIEMNSNLES
ncbi:hypothetical protein ACHAXS_008534 [Conticribra weissflogii]